MGTKIRREKTHDLTIYAACGCNKGLRRRNNEDNFYFAGEYLSEQNDGMGTILTWTGTMSDEYAGEFFAVYDGMGGGQYGEVASYNAACHTEELLERYTTDTDDLTGSLTEMCEALNDAVFESEAGLAVNQMGSTLAGYYFSGSSVWCCNVGDSRCYRLRDGVLRRLSVDHTDEETMKRSGITGRKPYLTQYLGVDPEEMRISPSVSGHTVMDGDQYLICSDGLSDMLTAEQMTDILLSGGDEEETVQTLIVNALKNGGRDNVTVIVCRTAAE